jgi:hypothetical protein
MSWKWLSRSVCHASSSPAGSPATAASSSASCSARSARRLARFGRAWLVYGAAVVLEVELADDLRPLGRSQLAEERLRVADRRPRHALEIRHARQRLEHLLGRPAAAVAPPEHEQRPAPTARGP